MKKLRRRGKNTARGWLAQAIKTYARALETTEPSVPREVLFDQVIDFTRQVLNRLAEFTPRSVDSVHNILEEALQALAKEFGTEEKLEVINQRRKASPTTATLEAERDDNFKGLTPLTKLAQCPPRKLSPALVRDSEGDLEKSTVDALRDFHPEIVLYSPQIPPNTGTIARLCAALSCRLHLIEPLGFDVSEKAFRRAGLDYWPFVELYVHSDWDSFLKSRPFRRIIFIETGGQKSPSEFSFEPGDLLVFGSETSGIPRHILTDCLENQRGHLVTIPMFDRGVRSLNLANSVSIVAHCALADLHAVKNSEQA